MFLCVLFAASACSQGVITTIAGADWIFPGDGQPALNAPLGGLLGIGLAVDAAGNYYLADQDNAKVMQVTQDGILHVIAGNGICCYSGDGGPATAASLGIDLGGVAVDKAGNVYICDTGDSVIRKITPDGIIHTFAGVAGVLNFTGDGGPASGATLNYPSAIAVDGAGNLYIADSYNFRIRKVSAKDGTITTVVGNGKDASAGDGGPATQASVELVAGLAPDNAGNLYFITFGPEGGLVRKVDANGIISSIGGAGNSGQSGVPALRAKIVPNGIATDALGNIYIADDFESRVVKIDATGTLTIIAGANGIAFSGDGGPATAAMLNHPHSVALSPDGIIYIADSGNFRIRAITPDGNINTVAGNGQFRLSGNGGPATRATLFRPTFMAADSHGNYYISEPDVNRVRKLSADGTISVFAGTGTAGFGGDGGPATAARLYYPSGVAVDAGGNVYIADQFNLVIRKVTPDGTISTFAGTPGISGFLGDRGQATRARLSFPTGIATDSAGNLYICDALNNRIRKVDTTGIINTIAGDGTQGDTGDGGLATRARIANPTGITLDSAGNIYFAEGQVLDQNDLVVAGQGNRVRKIDGNQTITTVAGTGATQPLGDGGPAVQASLFSPQGITFDRAGNLYIADQFNSLVRIVTTDGNINTFAGCNPAVGCYPDGFPANVALLSGPSGVLFDGAGNLMIADRYSNVVRAVLATLPSFQAAPLTLRFDADAGSPPTPQQTVALAGSIPSVPMVTSATTTDGGAWLQVTPAFGLLPLGVTVAADATQLAAGTYHGTVGVNAPFANPANASIDVTFTVRPAPPGKLNVKADSLSFAFIQGASAAAQTLNLSNDGGVGFDYAISVSGPGAAAVNVAPAAGNLAPYSAGSVTVTADPTGLAPGTYSVTLAVTDSAGEERDLPLTMTVTAIKQSISLLSRGLSFTAAAGGGVSPAQSIGVANSGQGMLNWTASASTLPAGASWLAVTPSGASNAQAGAAPLAVSVDPTGLAPGQYYGQVEIDSAGADNSPQFAMVVLNVLPGGSNPGPIVQPSGMAFAGTAGAESPGSQTITVTNLSPSPIAYTAGVVTVDGASWLVASPSRATVAPGATARIVVQPFTGTLAAGVYQGTITLVFAPGVTRAVNVTFVVNNGAASASKRRRRDASGGGCPSKLLPIFTSLNTGVTVPAGWPTGISVTVVDDCGTPLSSGSVVAQFSNGDPPLALGSLADGNWSGTWQAGNVASTVTITVTAQDADRGLAGSAQLGGGVAANPNIPVINPGGVVNSASLLAQAPLAPGSLVSVLGSFLAGGQNKASDLPWPTNMAGTSVAIQGRFIPLSTASDGRIDAILPYDLPMNTRLPLVVQRGSSLTLPIMVTVAPSAPAIFTQDNSGSGQGMIYGAAADGSAVLAAPGAPAHTGDTVSIVCTGLGVVNAPVSAGSAAPGSPAASAVTPIAVMIGGAAANVKTALLQPGLTGFYQVSATVPDGVSGDAVPVVLSVAGQVSPAVTMAVQ